MIIERLTRKEAIEAMNSWVGSSFTIPVLGTDYEQVREELVALFNCAKSAAGDNVKTYEMDVHFGAALYGYFMTKTWFNDRLACDDGFWRHLTLRVIPDLVGQRWGNSNADHYYTKPSRIWPKALWWYIHLSLKDSDLDATKEMLLSKNFTTDSIENLVERTGRSGTNIDVYRTIMSKYWKLEKVTGFDFRKVMKLNTAMAVVLEPVFCEGGVEGYVDSIIKDLSLA